MISLLFLLLQLSSYTAFAALTSTGITSSTLSINSMANWNLAFQSDTTLTPTATNLKIVFPIEVKVFPTTIQAYACTTTVGATTTNFACSFTLNAATNKFELSPKVAWHSSSIAPSSQINIQISNLLNPDRIQLDPISLQILAADGVTVLSSCSFTLNLQYGTN